MKKLVTVLYVVSALLGAVVSSPLVALYGSDVILSCTFPHKPDSGTRRVMVVWQRKDSSGSDQVVHSYYYQRDQLDQQGEAYRNRTQIFPEEVRKGNASLKLMRVRLEDEGSYTCYVGNEQDNVEHSTDLVVTAPYIEPSLNFDLSNQDDYILLVFTSSGGYPSAAIQWLNEAGNDITENSTTTQLADETGRFQIRSEVVFPAFENLSYTFILENRALQQRITRPVSVTFGNPSDPVINKTLRTRLLLLLPVAFVGLPPLVVMVVGMWKSSRKKSLSFCLDAS
nr:PREDICTED: CD276 antigen-like [Latimeria chalumnae]|eukprot:XP_014354195.1 PREDICTED: CD276 antigen-like [Latimeria chalumnae]